MHEVKIFRPGIDRELVLVKTYSPEELMERRFKFDEKKKFQVRGAPNHDRADAEQKKREKWK